MIWRYQYEWSIMDIITTEQLRSELGSYKNPDAKINRMRKHKELFKICRGLYTIDRHMIKEAVSGLVCGPSYVSFEDALAMYDLIPEYVVECSAATFGKQRNTLRKNDFGYYSFTNIPKKAFPYGVELYEYGGYCWDMAVPEKAICDILYTREPLKDADDVIGFLVEGMRIDEDDFNGLDKEKMKFFAGLYDRRNLKLLKEALS